MKNFYKLCAVAAFASLLASCTPGPVHLSPTSIMGIYNAPVAVKQPDGQVKYVSASINKKQKLMVPRSSGDDLVTNKILAEYAADPALSAYRIGVKTHRGEVTLTGRVPSEALKKRAIKIARYNRGVLVANADNLVVKP